MRYCRSQWPCGLRRRSSAARLLRLWARIPPRSWMFVCCDCCLLSGRGLCDGLITRPEESYRLWRVVCDQETSKTRRLKHATGLWQYKQKCCDVTNTNKQQKPWGIKLSDLVWSTDDFTEIPKRLTTWIYRVSQAECARLLERVPYVKLYRYNPKNLRVYPKLNGYGDNGQRSLKLWQLLHTYWLSNTYWNWQEYVVSVMLISVLNIKVTCEWHKAIKQTSIPVALMSENWPLTSNHYTLRASDLSQGRSELHLAIT